MMGFELESNDGVASICESEWEDIKNDRVIWHDKSPIGRPAYLITDGIKRYATEYSLRKVAYKTEIVVISE
jgi:hypothetical protein